MVIPKLLLNEFPTLWNITVFSAMKDKSDLCAGIAYVFETQRATHLNVWLVLRISISYCKKIPLLGFFRILDFLYMLSIIVWMNRMEGINKRINNDLARAKYWKTVLIESSDISEVRSRRRKIACYFGCNKTFTQQAHLNQHKRTLHDGLKPFSCRSCTRSFGKKFDLSSHENAVHRNLRLHACPVCGKAFAKRSNMLRHKTKLHPQFIVRQPL